MLASWVSIVSPYTQTQIPNYQLRRYRYLISASIYIQQDSTLKKNPHKIHHTHKPVCDVTVAKWPSSGYL